MRLPDHELREVLTRAGISSGHIVSHVTLLSVLPDSASVSPNVA